MSGEKAIFSHPTGRTRYYIPLFLGVVCFSLYRDFGLHYLLGGLGWLLVIIGAYLFLIDAATSYLFLDEKRRRPLITMLERAESLANNPNSKELVTILKAEMGSFVRVRSKNARIRWEIVTPSLRTLEGEWVKSYLLECAKTYPQLPSEHSVKGTAEGENRKAFNAMCVYELQWAHNVSGSAREWNDDIQLGWVIRQLAPGGA